nr:hypothetical protein BaRGS_024680 [Batillaria attramentaria]
MPISSGALEWPASFYRKPEEEERGSDAGSLTPVNSPRDYKWQPQLTNRENYETWRKEMDRKVNVQKEDVVIDSNRENSWDVIKRRRRRRCCLLGFCLSLAFTVLVATFVFAFLHFTGFDEFPKFQCTGHWREDFLAYRNGQPVR